MKFLASIIAILFIATNSVYSQQEAITDSTSRKIDRGINYTRLAVVGGVTAVGVTYGFILQKNLWWKGEKTDFYFNFDKDWRYAIGADKLGHFFFPYMVSGIYSQALEWAQMDSVSALWWGAGIGLAHQTFVEIRDGYSKDNGGGYLGFSWGDMSANILGAAYPLVQQQSKLLRNFNIKVSFYPSEQYKDGAKNVIFDDYESTYHWLSISVKNLLPYSIAEYYPAWINLAIGHSVKQLDGIGGGYHEIFIGLDWNLAGIPIEGKLWKTVAKTLGYYHFPAPAVKIYPNVVWYGVRF
ncbi:MAG: DUF2279 domain-containing protein [Ignavibacteriae bacterium]|nr:DUF2279 domain-containing protein [Ignavibacteriota bacterium]